MKFFLSLLFLFTTPLVIFFASIVYAPSANSMLKHELAQEGVYAQLSTQVGKLNTDDPTAQAVTDYFKEKFTPNYIQSKTETTLDDSSAWITGTSNTPPILSFKDLKDDLIAQHPDILSTIESFTREAKREAEQQDTSDESSNQMQNVQLSQSMNMLDTFVQSDFSINLQPYLIGVKTTYNLLHILVPVLAILSLLYLVLLFVLSKTKSSGFLWVGVTLIISGIGGFGVIFLNKTLALLITTIISSNSNHVVQYTSPVMLGIMNHFMTTYVQYQKMANIVFLAVGTISLILGVVLRQTTSVSFIDKYSSVDTLKIRKKKQ